MPDYIVPIRVSEIGEFIRFRSCERRFKLGLENRRLARSVPFSERLFNALDPVLQAVGREAENAWERALRDQGATNLLEDVQPEDDNRTSTWQAFRAAVTHLTAGAFVYGREIEILHEVGTFELSGRMDFLVLLWDRGTPRLRVVEGKASRKDRTYHRLQLAAYVTMLRRLVRETPLMVSGQPIEEDSIEGVVVRIDETTNEPQDMIHRPALNLDIEIADLERLLSSEGLLATIVDADLNTLDYQLDAKCDGCVFNVHCLPESARLRRLELTGLPPTTCRILRETGVETIDDLAALDTESAEGELLRQAPGFDANLAQLVAAAAARCSTLPRGEGDPDNFQVVPLPHSGAGQLPLHEMAGQRLVRVYLQVDYDYTENRVGALSAHVTDSDWMLHTQFDPETRRPAPGVDERPYREDGEQVNAAVERRSLATRSRDVVTYQTQDWTGIGDQDTGAERQLVQQFLHDVVDAIGEVAEAERAPIHFYVYSRSEMTQLVEACARAGSTLLSHLRELLGSRESLEQLIFSCVQDEVDSRFALGWTGRGLAVATSLSWFGQRYHWTRRVSGASVELDRVFEQDILTSSRRWLSIPAAIGGVRTRQAHAATASRSEADFTTH